MKGENIGMKRNKRNNNLCWGVTKAFVLASMITACGVTADADEHSDQERIAALERKLAAFDEEVERLRFRDAFVPVSESAYALGPAASKVYFKEQGLSIGGYGEGFYSILDGDDSDIADFLRAVLYFGYKYDSKWVLNTEFEFEHASTSKKGSASVEFAYLDYLHDPGLNLRMGLLLVPVGLVNELHEPILFPSALRPVVENRIIPTTWRENGVGIHGEYGSASYRAYVVNGLRGEKFAAKGLRGGRQKGSKVLADDLAGVIRADFEPKDGLLLGGAVYAGNSGQDLDVGVFTLLYEIHADWAWRGLRLRALGAVADLDDVAELNRITNPDTPDGQIDSIGEKQTGWYVEASYDVLNQRDTGQHQLSPYFRFSQVDTQSDVPAGFVASGKNDLDILTVGLNYKPRDEIVFKFDYQTFDDAVGGSEDRFNLAMGYAF